VPWRPLDRAGDEEPVRLRESLDKLARHLGAPDAGVLSGVFSRWEEVVGAAVAAHARPVSLRDGTLRVVVDQPGWATQLRYLESDVVERCAAVLGPGAVRVLEVRVEGSRKA
jgi:predicted nucleic acid-binding Zn ribbon protein